ncbi:dihydrofolate reductase [Undibacterium sp.]|uniref:dihydrofolate reductase n=1 Tax=Undibacterium sp. TaxID=1914977 RepID=UPI00374CE4DC
MSSLIIIVATDSNMGIGINNALPWKLSEDMAHFKSTTTGHAVIMGRKTFDSIGRALPNRRNIVVSRNRDWHHDGVECVHSLDEAVKLIAGTDAFVIGGTQIYEQALPLADKLVVTEIHRRFQCDAFFPAISAQEWTETARDARRSEANDFTYAFVTYNKNRGTHV